MRPPDLRHNSMARSSAQSEGCELSTGTNTSRYTGSSLGQRTGCEVKERTGIATARCTDAQRGSENRSRDYPLTIKPLCACASSLCLSWYQLPAFCIPHCDGIHWTRVAREEQALAVDLLRLHEHHHAVLVQLEAFGRRFHAVAEPDAGGAVDANPEPMDDPLLEAAHIPSSPSSARAVSMTAAVISPMPCCLA